MVVVVVNGSINSGWKWSKEVDGDGSGNASPLNLSALDESKEWFSYNFFKQ